jgi:hypothetical protein
MRWSHRFGTGISVLLLILNYRTVENGYRFLISFRVGGSFVGAVRHTCLYW